MTAQSRTETGMSNLPTAANIHAIVELERHSHRERGWQERISDSITAVAAKKTRINNWTYFMTPPAVPAAPDGRADAGTRFKFHALRMGLACISSGDLTATRK